jgi:precorrin-4/cobalt-precorrin-4 C11-methyltransferase
MPEGEQLADLARHRATLAIHLGVRHIERIVADLTPHYGSNCPVAVVFRASWPDEEKVLGTLADIARKVLEKGIERTALIVVGHVLNADGFTDSSLYRKA